MSAAMTSRSPLSATILRFSGAPRVSCEPARIVGALPCRCTADAQPATRRHPVTHRVTLIPGDGIGPEVVEAARRVVERHRRRDRWDEQEIGLPRLRADGRGAPSQALASIRANGVALKGPIETPAGAGVGSANIALRKDLDLFANVRPCRHYPGVPSRVRRRRPRGRPGEHGGRLHGRRVRGRDRRAEGADRVHRRDDRAHDPRGQRHLGEGDLARGGANGSPGSRSKRPDAAAEEGHGRATRRTS